MAKSSYRALVGIDFEQFKPPIRVEAGESIPAKVTQSEIDELIDLGLIRELSGRERDDE